MTIEEAMIHLRLGRKIKHEDWGDCYISNCIGDLNTEGFSEEIDIRELFSNGWILYKEHEGK